MTRDIEKGQFMRNSNLNLKVSLSLEINLDNCLFKRIRF